MVKKEWKQRETSEATVAALVEMMASASRAEER